MIFQIHEEHQTEPSKKHQYFWDLRSKGRIVADGDGYNTIRSLLKTVENIFKESPRRIKELKEAARLVGYNLDGTRIKDE